jgi:tRNA/tmRNA/rRNA uracil-C5-methylase (TrmA/RlmC/RlmD family)
MSKALLEKHSRFRVLQAQYAAFITEQSIVTAQVISTATTARLEAIDLELCRWEGVHKDEIKAFGGIDTFTPPTGPGVFPSTGLESAAGALRWAGASARHPC